MNSIPQYPKMCWIKEKGSLSILRRVKILRRIICELLANPVAPATKRIIVGLMTPMIDQREDVILDILVIIGDSSQGEVLLIGGRAVIGLQEGVLAQIGLLAMLGGRVAAMLDLLGEM
jgi:hypothetical protein